MSMDSSRGIKPEADYNFDVQFIGPGQQSFDSFHSLATYYLGNFFPNWRFYDFRCESYVFPFKTVRKVKISMNCCSSRSEIDAAASANSSRTSEKREKTTGNSPISDISDEEAEFLVYDAIRQLVADRIQAPFLAVHSWDLALKLRKPFKIFPQNSSSVESSSWREHDFVLIGPKIGIVIIEVKNSSFANPKRDFLHSNPNLPDAYMKGLGQLRMAEEFFKFLSDRFGVAIPNEMFTRVLFTPQLDRERFDGWVQTLNSHALNQLPKDIHGIKKLYKNDLTSTNPAEKPILYTSLREILERAPILSGNTAIYEFYAPLVAALKSLVIFPGQQMATLEKSLFFKASLLNLDQQNVLNGGNRQFVIGAAGTGKTVVLKAKALEKLDKGGSVVVLVPWSYQQQYKTTFESYGFPEERYKIYDLLAEKRKAYSKLKQLQPEIFRNFGLIELDHAAIIDRLMVTHSNKMREIFHWAFQYDHAIVDDAFDDLQGMLFPGSTFQFLALAMAVAHRIDPDKVLWAGLDPYTSPNVGYPRLGHEDGSGTTKISEILNIQNRVFSVSILRRVMRCPENIFSVAYDPRMEWAPDIQPILGTALEGIATERVSRHFPASSDALEELWCSVKDCILELTSSGICLNEIGLLTCDYLPTTEFNRENQFLTQQRRNHWPKISNPRFVLKTSFQKKFATEWPHVAIVESHPPQKQKKGQTRMEKEQLVVEGWYDVSSLEFPVVIFVSCLPRKLSDAEHQHIMYQKYRSVSRATRRLIMVEFSYDK